MASIIYCINHPKHPGEKFFFIQNTFLEFQETVPVDLSTFLCILAGDDDITGLMEIIDDEVHSPSIENFKEIWEQLKVNGISASVTDDYNNELMEGLDMKGLYEDAKYAGSGWRSIKNKEHSRNFHEQLDKGQDIDWMLLIEISYDDGKWDEFDDRIHIDDDSFKHNDYFKSRNYLMRFLYNKTGANFNPKIYDDSVALSFIYKNSKLLEAWEESLGLEMVPHKFRCLGFFKDECERKNQHYLIPVPDETPANYPVYTGEIAEVIDILSKYPELVVFLEESMKSKTEVIDLLKKVDEEKLLQEYYEMKSNDREKFIEEDHEDQQDEDSTDKMTSNDEDDLPF